MSFLFSHRKDIQGPCQECPRRKPGCRDACREPAFLEAQRLRRLITVAGAIFEEDA